MTKKLNWRLAKLPTPDELRELVKDKIITQEEARDILFKEKSDDEERDEKSLQNEIIFLRNLVEKLSQNKNQIVEIIREVKTPAYEKYYWWKPYATWCDLTDCSSVTYLNGTSYSGQTAALHNTNTPFNSIETF